MVSTTDFIAAIELGSSKIAGVVGKKNSDGSIQVLAYAKEDSSSFIRKGVIFNLDKTAQSLTSIINKLEGAVNSSIGRVYVGIGGQSLHTVRNTISRNLQEETIISQELIDSIRDENCEIPLVDMDILDVAPQEYKIGNNQQADPVGVAGSNIEGRFMNIVARASIRKNLERCFEQAKIEIADTLIAPLATANAVLSESEMRSGCALVDFGADSTTVSIYKGNILRFLTVLPIGGKSITNDITSLQMEEEEAEALKLKYGNAIFDEEEIAEAPAIVLEESGRSISRIILSDIIEARAEEIVVNVVNQIQLSKYDDKLLSGIIITGGTSNLKNIDELLRRRSKIEKIRVAKSIRNELKTSAYDILKDAMHNTLLALIVAGKENCYQAKPVVTQPEPEPVKVEAPDPAQGLFHDDPALLEQEKAAIEARKKKEEEEKQRKEEEKRRKEEEKRRKLEEKKNKPSWFKSTFDKLSNEIFSDEDMK